MSDSIDEQELECGFELDSLNAWARLVGGTTRRFYGDGVQVDVYGQADALYLVVERRVSASPPRSVDQYVVDTLGFANPLMKLFDLLRAFDFSLSRLLARLAQIEYDDVDGSARLEGIDIFHSFIQETLASDEGEQTMKSDNQKTAAPRKKQIVITKKKVDPAVSAKARTFKEVARSLSPVADKKSGSLPPDVEEFEEWE